MGVEALIGEIIHEMRHLVKDIHKIPKERNALNRHAYRVSVLIDLSTVLVRAASIIQPGGECKYRLMARKEAIKNGE